MNRLKKVIVNSIILFALGVIFFIHSGLYLNPISAHKSSERSIHYGPSKIIHIEDLKNRKYILCKYDKWVSCNTINRKLFFFWRFGNQPIGFENDTTKFIDYSSSYSIKGYNGYNKLYGIINNKDITKIELILYDGTVLTQTQTDFYDDLFLFHWEVKEKKDISMACKIIKGYNSNNNVIFSDSR
jgi:hypothetical protein